MASASTCLRATALSQGLAAGMGAEKECSVQRSAFFGSRSVSKNALRQKVPEARARVTCESNRRSKWASLKEEPKQAPKKVDRWGGLGTDTSDDQQDITRGRGMVDSVFQGASGLSGTQNAIMSSYDYISTAQRTLSNVSAEGYYISPTFMDKLVIHITKNFLKLPNIKVPLILGVWGGKGQGKSFQAELVFAMLGINPIVMSAGELESGNAGEPAKLIRQRYREAADIIKKGKMCALFINDLDAGAGRMGNTTQYTVNNQMVNATLMNIADNPTNVQLPGVYNKEENPRVPIIVTGNDFSTLYAPLIRDGRMEKFYWAPTREDRIGVCTGIFKEDGIKVGDIERLVDTFPGQSIDFFGALRSRVYDDLVRDWVKGVGYENLGRNLVNSKNGPPAFEKPRMTLDILLSYGNKLVEEQENVKRVQFAEEYLSGAALGDSNRDDKRIASGGFYSGQAAKPTPPPVEKKSTSSYDSSVSNNNNSFFGSSLPAENNNNNKSPFSAPVEKKPAKETPSFSWDSPVSQTPSSWDSPVSQTPSSWDSPVSQTPSSWNTPAEKKAPEVLPRQEGCTDPQASNFSPSAIWDDGTCEYDMSTWPA